MKKIISLLLVVALLCTGCTGGKTSDEGNAEVGTEEKEKDGIHLYVLTMEKSFHAEPFQMYVIDKFEEMYPGKKVYLEFGVTEENGITLADAIRNLNIEMMAGNGPDVLFLDGLPVHEYIEKGMLEDMSGLLEELKNDGETFFENVLTAYEQDGKICAVPTTFTVPIVVGDEAAVQAETIHDFAELATQRADDPTPVFAKCWIEHLPEIFMSGWKDVFQDNQKVDKKTLMQLLKDMKQMAEASGFDKDLSYPHLLKVSPLYENAGGSVAELLREPAQMLTMTLGETGGFLHINSARKIKPVAYEYLNKKSGNMFFPNQIIGINVSSEKKEEAATFVKYFLSSELTQEEVGYHTYGSGCVEAAMYGELVNKGNKEKEMDVSEEGQVSSTYENFLNQGTETWYIYCLTPQEKQEFFTFLDKADTMIDIDYTLLQSMMELVENYLFERDTLESVVDEIANKVELYQAE